MGMLLKKIFLIILHGGPGGYGLQYRVNTIKSEIEKNNAVVYFDQRGSGNSQGGYSKSDVTVDLMAEDVLALVKVLKAKYGDDARFYLMGHSWGGTLGTATLLKGQDNFLGWIDVDGSHNPGGSYEEYREDLQRVANEQMALGNSIDYWQGVIDVVQSVSPRYNEDDFNTLNFKSHEAEETLSKDKIINEAKWETGGSQPVNSFILLWNNVQIASILLDKGLFDHVSYTDQLPNITIPSLVLWGKHDLIVPTSNAQEAFDGLGTKDKELFIFEKSGHSPMASEPLLFSEKVIEFINRHK